MNSYFPQDLLERKRIRRALIINLLIAVPVFFVSIYAIFDAGEVSIRQGANIVIAFVSLILVWRKQFEISGLLLLSIFVQNILYSVSRSEGIAIVGIVIFVLLGVGLISQTFRNHWFPAGYSLIGLASLGIFVFDLFYPYQRRSPGITGLIVSGSFLGIIAIIYAFFVIRNFRNYSLQSKFISTVSFLIGVSVIVSTAAVSLIVSQTALDQAGRTIQSFSDATSRTILFSVEQNKEVLNLLKENPFVLADLQDNNGSYGASSETEVRGELEEIQSNWVDSPGFQKIFIQQQESNAFIEGSLQNFSQTLQTIAVLDKYGAVAASSQLIPRFYYGNESWWEDLQREGSYIALAPDDAESFANGTHPYVSAPVAPLQKVNGGPYLLYAEGIYDPRTNEFLGAMIGRSYLTSYGPLFEPSVDNELYSEVDFFFNDQLKINYTDNGQMTVDARQAEVTLADYQSEFTDGRYGVLEEDGLQQLFTLISLTSEENQFTTPDFDWQLVLVQDEQIALGSSQTQRQAQVLIGALVLIVSILVAVALGRIISTPILDLRDAAVAVTEGDFGRRVDIAARDEFGRLGTTFNQMAQQVQTSLGQLENRVAERTQALEASSRISRQISTILNRQELLEAIVRELKSDFDYYHVHIYTMNETKDRLMMSYGSGEVGQILKERGHSLALNQGLVGRAASSNLSVLVPDVRQNPNWTPNDLLPDTKAELAVPIAFRDEVLGVIDIQDNEVHGLSIADRSLIESIAGPLAASLRNADFYQEAQARAQHEGTINTIRQRILQTRNVNNALKIAARELAQATNGKVAVRLSSEGEQNGSSKQD
ncbi:MAG: GAF domain-containing protein [Ardenticatenaceae bacterium]|nr:GAF domain-containing protein [Ardenticatenaceae bacterium]